MLWDEVTQTLDQAAGVNVSSPASEGNNSSQPSSSKSGAQSFGVRMGDLSLAILMAVAVFALTRTHFSHSERRWESQGDQYAENAWRASPESLVWSSQV